MASELLPEFIWGCIFKALPIMALHETTVPQAHGMSHPLGKVTILL